MMDLWIIIIIIIKRFIHKWFLMMKMINCCLVVNIIDDEDQNNIYNYVDGGGHSEWPICVDCDEESGATGAGILRPGIIATDVL